MCDRVCDSFFSFSVSLLLPVSFCFPLLVFGGFLFGMAFVSTWLGCSVRSRSRRKGVSFGRRRLGGRGRGCGFDVSTYVVKAILTPLDAVNDYSGEAALPLEEVFVAMEKRADPLLRTEVDMLARNEETREDLQAVMEKIPDENLYCAEAMRTVISGGKPNWESALNSFNRNVAFRANRIFNPRRIADYYITLCLHCLHDKRWREAMSALAYVGIPPSKYANLSDKGVLHPFWTYDPSFESPGDIVFKADVPGGEVVIDLPSIALHVAEVMLDMDVSTPSSEALEPPKDERELYGEEMGKRISPHEWLYRQIPDAVTNFAVRDMILAITRVAVWSALQWQAEQPSGCFLSLRIKLDRSDDDAPNSIIPTARSLVNAIGTEIGDPDFDMDGDAIFGPDTVAKFLYYLKNSPV